MATVNGPGGNAVEDVDGLRSAVDEVTGELRRLTARVKELATAAEQLQRTTSLAGTAKGASAPAPSSVRRKLERVAVVVRPLPEIAMAAMAETTLRDLPGVSEVVSSERVEDWARFTLEVLDETDLVAEMRTAMPVPFEVVESGPDEIAINLRWAWGTSR